MHLLNNNHAVRPFYLQVEFFDPRARWPLGDFATFRLCVKCFCWKREYNFHSCAEAQRGSRQSCAFCINSER